MIRAMNERSTEIGDLSEELKQLIRETEVTGKRTIFSRGGKAVAILTSHDEYLALRETIDLSAQPEILSEIAAAENEARAGDLLLPEDLFVE